MDLRIIPPENCPGRCGEILMNILINWHATVGVNSRADCSGKLFDRWTPPIELTISHPHFGFSIVTAGMNERLQFGEL